MLSVLRRVSSTVHRRNSTKNWTQLHAKTVLGCCVGTVAIGGIVLSLILGTIRYNVSPSLPRGFYVFRPLLPWEQISRGAIVSMTPAPWVVEELQRVVPGMDVTHPWFKTVVGRVGDQFCLQPGSMWVNDELVAVRTLLADYLLTPLEGCTTLDAQSYVVLTEHPRSYDSRYFGVVARSQIHGRVYPLWTWGETR